MSAPSCSCARRDSERDPAPPAETRWRRLRPQPRHGPRRHRPRQGACCSTRRRRAAARGRLSGRTPWRLTLDLSARSTARAARRLSRRRPTSTCDRRRRDHRPPRLVRLRQDLDLAHDRRLRGRQRRPDPRRRAPDQRPPARPAQRGHGFRGLLALPAADDPRQYRLRAVARPPAEGRGRPASSRSPSSSRSTTSSTATRRPSPAASSSAPASPAPSSAAPTYSFSTSRCPSSSRGCAPSCGRGSRTG